MAPRRRGVRVAEAPAAGLRASAARLPGAPRCVQTQLDAQRGGFDTQDVSCDILRWLGFSFWSTTGSTPVFLLVRKSWRPPCRATPRLFKFILFLRVRRRGCGVCTTLPGSDLAFCSAGAAGFDPGLYDAADLRCARQRAVGPEDAVAQPRRRRAEEVVSPGAHQEPQGPDLRSALPC